MDYIGKKCPVCENYFHADDDIVVCPDCGTPHHRECYESLGHCCNESLHKTGFDYSETETKEEKDHVIVCKRCGKENEADAFFCKYCATPLTDDQKKTDNQQNTAYNQQGQNFAMPFLDPLGGVPSDTDLGDGITAGEAAKYVKQNTPYFIRVFANIRNLNKSKFNFAAALFSGGYMLYRKMYRIGAFITAVQAAMILVRMYLAYVFTDLYTGLANCYINATSTEQMVDSFSKYINGLTSLQVFMLYLPSLLSIAQIILMIVIGLTFNRQYMNDCKKKIIAIKNSAKEGENPDTLLQTKGGVNTSLAISLLITALIIEYLPSIIFGLL